MCRPPIRQTECADSFRTVYWKGVSVVSLLTRPGGVNGIPDRTRPTDFAGDPGSGSFAQFSWRLRNRLGPGDILDDRSAGSVRLTPEISLDQPKSQPIPPRVRSRSFGLGFVRAVLVLGSFAQFWSRVRSRSFGPGFVRAILVFNARWHLGSGSRRTDLAAIASALTFGLTATIDDPDNEPLTTDKSQIGFFRKIRPRCQVPVCPHFVIQPQNSKPIMQMQPPETNWLRSSHFHDPPLESATNEHSRFRSFVARAIRHSLRVPTSARTPSPTYINMRWFFETARCHSQTMRRSAIEVLARLEVGISQNPAKYTFTFI